MKINYIIQLTEALNRLTNNEQMTAFHISLYLVLFQIWNSNHFKNPIEITRDKVMKKSKIKSRTTYIKCIKALEEGEFLHYKPSFNPVKESQIYMTNFCTGGVQEMVTSRPSNGQVVSKKWTTPVHLMVPYIENNKKHLKHLKGENSQKLIFNFFEKENSTKKEAEKFFNYYESVGWKTSGGKTIENWRAAARSWILRAEEIQKTKKAADQKMNYLHVNNNKDYSEPL